MLWMDESLFEFHGSKKNLYIPMSKEKRKNIAPVKETFMFWGCICLKGLVGLVPIDETMNHQTYLNVLNDYAFKSRTNQPLHCSRTMVHVIKEKQLHVFYRDLG